MSPTNTKVGKSIMKIAALITSITVIIGALGWVYNEYQNYKSTTEKELDSRIDDRLKEHGNEILLEINEKTDLFHEVVDSLRVQIDMINENIEGDQLFAIGFRGDGTGEIFYRDKFGVLYKVYLSSDNSYYYVKDGLAIYLD